jgi:hypothetical protein
LLIGGETFGVKETGEVSVLVEIENSGIVEFRELREMTSLRVLSQLRKLIEAGLSREIVSKQELVDLSLKI